MSEFIEEYIASGKAIQAPLGMVFVSHCVGCGSTIGKVGKVLKNTEEEFLVDDKDCKDVLLPEKDMSHNYWTFFKGKKEKSLVKRNSLESCEHCK